MATSVELDGLIIMGTKIPKDRQFSQMGQELATETFKHLKSISVERFEVGQKLIPILQKGDIGVSIKSKSWMNDFMKDLAQHKHWSRFE